MSVKWRITNHTNMAWWVWRFVKEFPYLKHKLGLPNISSSSTNLSTNLALALPHLWLQKTQNRRVHSIGKRFTSGKICRAQQLHTWTETDVLYQVPQQMDHLSLSACIDDSTLHVVALTDRLESPCMLTVN